MALNIIKNEKVDFKVRDENGQTILHNCLMKNYDHLFFKVIEILSRKIYSAKKLARNHSVNDILSLTCNQGIGLQHIAAYRNQLEVLKALDKININLFSKTTLNLDVFYYAAQNDSVKSFLWLLLKNKNKLNEDSENTPLH